MAEAVPNDKLRQYLRELTPEARALLAAELERAMLRGDEPPGASFILDELRSEARNSGRKMPRVGNPQRLFFSPLEPFLVEDAPERKHRGRLSRACLDPIWGWICRDLMPQEARTYTDQVQMLLAANEKNGAEQVARAFQDLTEQRMRDALAAAKSDDKKRRQIEFQIGTPNAIEDIRETAGILRVRDALAVIGSRLPATISNLADEQLENVKALLDSPIGRHSRCFPLCAADRDEPPRLALAAHPSCDRCGGNRRGDRVAETPYAVAVEIVLTDMERMIAGLRDGLKARAQRRGCGRPEGSPRRGAVAAHRNGFVRRFRLGTPARGATRRSLAAPAGRDRQSARPGAPPAASALSDRVRHWLDR